jgi:hypothetical protein
MLLVADITAGPISALVRKFGLSIEYIPDGQSINGSFWGEPEAGVMGNRVYVRGDTPVHSLLHETSHLICMTAERRTLLEGDAGGDDLEECAVCFLQILLADELPGAGKERLMQDMDDWGYSFRLGGARRWFEDDARDARAWLEGHDLIQADGRPSFKLRNA